MGVTGLRRIGRPMSRVEVRRGGIVESVHTVHIAVVDASGCLRAMSGSPDVATFARSAIKPIQALPLIEDGVADRFDLGVEGLALCCASHSGEDRHVEIARGMLRKIGVEESALACGAHAPYHEPTARRMIERGSQPGRVHNNCSGKHAGMLALAVAHGWPVAGYEKSDHPVQQRMLGTVARLAGVPEQEIPIAIDGCGVVTFALTLEAMAGAFARLAAAARRKETAPARVFAAMAKHPWAVGGTGRLCTALMQLMGGRILVKTGAEGVYCAAIPGAELGIALKVEDGAKRASEPALIAALCALRLMSPDEREQLIEYGAPRILNTRGDVVGGISAVVELEARA